MTEKADGSQLHHMTDSEHAIMENVVENALGHMFAAFRSTLPPDVRNDQCMAVVADAAMRVCASAAQMSCVMRSGPGVVLTAHGCETILQQLQTYLTLTVNAAIHEHGLTEEDKALLDAPPVGRG